MEVSMKKLKGYKDFKMFSKDQAYWERNQLVCALSKIYPSWMELHPYKDKSWDKDWRNIVFIEIPVRCEPMNFYPACMEPWHTRSMQMSWHLHKDDVVYFKHLKKRRGNSWDGHTTEEKYERLKFIDTTEKPTKKWWEFWK